MEIMLELDKQGNLTTSESGKTFLSFIASGLDRINCDKVGCDGCPLSCSNCGCALIEVEKKFLEISKKS